MMTRWQNVNGIYQIYPRSFKDSNNDGIGDLAGITKKLKYIKGDPDSLGIDAIWISPFYRSPMADFGYDVSDYFSVDPLFGDMEDFKNLLEEAHGREIKVMIDYVPNHTSDEHSWFLASKSSRENEKRQWYIWRDPASDGGSPNNWQSVFGGSAWQFDEHTGQYYMHSFLTKQPDLNWENPEVRKAMTDVLDFWLSMGVDGIRADAVRWMSKDLEFRDNPPNPDFKEGDDPYSRYLPRYSRYGPKLFDYLKQIAATVERHPDRIILFEDYVDPNIGKQEQYTHFYSVNRAVAAPFNFEGMQTSYSTEDFRLLINEFQMLMQGELRPFYCFGNHDKPRLASRVGLAQARLIAMLQLTLPGIPVVYYGDELGMHDVDIPADKVQDPFEKQEPGLGLGRDPGRTPMQWSPEPNAGFSTATPWLPISADSSDVNVATETNDPSSTLSLYRALLAFRSSSATLKSGRYVEWVDTDNRVFGYVRAAEDEALLILLNMSDVPIDCVREVDGEVIYSTHPFAQVKVEGCIVLRPHQGVIIRRAAVSV